MNLREQISHCSLAHVMQWLSQTPRRGTSTLKLKSLATTTAEIDKYKGPHNNIKVYLHHICTQAKKYAYRIITGIHVLFKYKALLTATDKPRFVATFKSLSK